MIKCPHCGAMNQPTENYRSVYCSTCLLDMKNPQANLVQEPISPSKASLDSINRFGIIALLIIAAVFFVLWLIATIGASGLSDT